MPPRKSALKRTRSEEYIANRIHLGDEPKFKNKELTKGDCCDAFNWYNYMCSRVEARTYLEEYFEACEDEESLQRLRQTTDTWLPLTACWIARLVLNGYTLPEEVISYLATTIETTFYTGFKTALEPDNDNVKVTAQDRIRDRLHDILGEVEGLIDDYIEGDEEFSLYHWLQEKNIPAVYSKGIIEKLNPVLLELIEAYEGKDPQLVEAYAHIKKAKLKDMIVFYNNLIEDADTFANNTKKARAPRKKKPVSVEKVIKNFKYQKEDSNYKLVSIDPSKIIGAQELWTFNTKYKVLTVLRSLDGGLQVKGTTITNVNEQTSLSRTTGRKANEFVSRVMNSGKVALRKVMDELKTFAPLATRTNENTILMRVMT